MGQHVKSRLEGVLETASALGQSPDLAEFPRKERNDEACFAEIDGAEDQCAGFLRRHCEAATGGKGEQRQILSQRMG
jgi:hypothetical protein